MSFITFIYRISEDPHTYYGKYAFNRISDDHEGLDHEIKNLLYRGYKMHRKNNGMCVLPFVSFTVGILSYSSNKYIPVYSTEEEYKCFDFYCVEYDYELKYYIDGEYISKK